MKKISKILFTVVCAGVCGVALANVATTAGNNLTAYNGGASSNNNKWNTVSNSRSGATSSAPATANFGNCNAVVLRCASPKCSGGGCMDMMVARSIVAGCVASNESCKKHGDPLIDAITGQIVAQSTATANAQAAAAAASQSNAQVEQMQMQMQQMQASMQESMNAMQAQMAQQNEMANQQLQSALAEQRSVMEAAQAAAAESATSAVATAGMEGMTVAEQVAAKNNMDVDVLVRSQSLGEIETAVEDATKKMDDLKKVLSRLLEYGGCDSSANHCEGPKRVKKFKDIANEFFEPYEGVAESMYDAMMLAMMLGVDISQVVMMLSSSCNMWGKYMCDVCSTSDVNAGNCLSVGNKYYYRVETYSKADDVEESKWGRVKPQQQHCRLVEILSDGAEVQREWIDSNSGITGNIQVACATDTLGNIGIFSRRNKMNSLIDIESVRDLVNQDAYGVCKKGGEKTLCMNYCATRKTDTRYQNLQTAVKNKTIKKAKCQKESNGSLGNASGQNEDVWPNCTYFPQEYALCTVHAYNIGETLTENMSSSELSEMQEVIALKSTVIAQMIKQQYDALNTMVKQLKTHLRKAVLTTKTEIATGNVSGGSSGGSSSSARQNGVYLSGAGDCMTVSGGSAGAVQCLTANSTLIMNASSKSDARRQLDRDLSAANQWGICGTCKDCDKCCDDPNNVKTCPQQMNVAIQKWKEKQDRENSRYGRYPY